MNFVTFGLIAMALIGLHANSADAQQREPEDTRPPPTYPLTLVPREPALYCTQYGSAYAWGNAAAGISCYGDAEGGLCTDGASFWSEANPCNSSHP